MDEITGDINRGPLKLPLQGEGAADSAAAPSSAVADVAAQALQVSSETAGEAATGAATLTGHQVTSTPPDPASAVKINAAAVGIEPSLGDWLEAFFTAILAAIQKLFESSEPKSEAASATSIAPAATPTTKSKAQENYESAKKNYENLKNEKAPDPEALQQARKALFTAALNFADLAKQEGADLGDEVKKTLTRIITEDLEAIKKIDGELQKAHKGIITPEAHTKLLEMRSRLTAGSPTVPTEASKTFLFLANLVKMDERKRVVLGELAKYEENPILQELGLGTLYSKAKESLEKQHSVICEQLRSSVDDLLKYLENCPVRELKIIFEADPLLQGKTLTQVFDQFLESFKTAQGGSEPDLLAKTLMGERDFIAAIQRRMNDPNLEAVENAMIMYGTKAPATETEQYKALAAMQKFLREDARLAAFTDATKKTRPETILTCFHERQQALASLPDFKGLEKKWGAERSITDDLKKAWNARSLDDAKLAGFSEQDKYTLRGSEIIEAFKVDGGLKEKFLDGEKLKADLLVQSFYAGELDQLPEELKKTIKGFVEGHLTKKLLDGAKEVSARLIPSITPEQKAILKEACSALSQEVEKDAQQINEECMGTLGELHSSRGGAFSEDNCKELVSAWDKTFVLRGRYQMLSKRYESLPDDLKGPPLSEMLGHLGTQLEGMEAALLLFITPSTLLLKGLETLQEPFTNPENYRQAASLMKGPDFAFFASLQETLQKKVGGRFHERFSQETQNKLIKLNELSAKAALITPESLEEAYQMDQSGINAELQDVEGKLADVKGAKLENLIGTLRVKLENIARPPQNVELEGVEAATQVVKKEIEELKKQVAQFQVEINKIHNPTGWDRFTIESQAEHQGRIREKEQGLSGINMRLEKLKAELKTLNEQAEQLRAAPETKESAELLKIFVDDCIGRHNQLQGFLLGEGPSIDLTGWEGSSTDNPTKLREEAMKLHKQLTGFLGNAQFATGPVVLKARKAALERELANWEKVRPSQQ